MVERGLNVIENMPERKTTVSTRKIKALTLVLTFIN